MINFLDFFDLHLQIIQFSNNISDNLLKSIIYDSQFEQLNYDYDILFILNKISAFNQQPNTEKTIQEIQSWIDSFIIQLSTLSKYKYSENEILIFKTYLFYKLILRYHLLTAKIENLNECLNNILETLSLDISENCSAWLAKEQLRRLFLEFFLINSTFILEYNDDINNQLQIARQNEIKKNELENILDNIQIR